MTISKEMEDALREVQRMALEIICTSDYSNNNKPPDAAVKTLGGIYNYCETVLRRGRLK